MINIYYAERGNVEKISGIKPGCWISLINPTENETQEMIERFNIDADNFKAALDDEERSRIEFEDDYTMILVNVPIIEKSQTEQLYSTIPLSVFLVGDVIITVCLHETNVLNSFINGRMRNFYTHMKTRFVLQLLYKTSILFLQYLRSIDKMSEEIEQKLHKSTKNSELIELLRLEKSLVYFTTSLRSNEVVLEKLLRSESIKKYTEDTDLLEDVIVENKQAIEMANIYSGILSGMMDAFASVISNNLNMVMKFLAVITTVMSIPTMIFSAYGMNVELSGMPFALNHFGFAIVILISLIISVFVAMILIKKKVF